jgi:two-component system, cell cycle sensor histidine kinase and response regulator CckA
MSTAPERSLDLASRYDAGIAHYVVSGDRDGALAEAFALGREAIDAGLGILDVCAIHRDALFPILVGSAAELLARTSERTSEFFTEALAPFDMVNRGFRETNAEIVNLNQEMQRQVEELRQLAAIVEAADDAIHTIGPENTILSWNPAAERLYGYSAAEAVGQSDDMLVPQTHADERGALVVLLRQQEHLAQFETIRSRKDGSFVEVSLTVSPIADGGGGIVAAAVIARDISARMRAEEERTELELQLRQAHKMEAVGNLAGGIAHDFNNLLTVIKGYSSLLIERLQDDDLSHDATAISEAANRASELTKQLLAFSRRQVLQPEQAILNDVVGETLNLLERIIGEDIQVDLDLATSVDPILIDRGQLAQVILNLAINAREAMTGGGSISVKTANVELDAAYAAQHVDVIAGPYVLLEMSDSGRGMDAETRDRVFDPFFTTKQEGTGLGLATVYGIVKQSGGHIVLDSEPGVGTTFTIHFPSSGEPTPATLRAPRETESPDGTETILLVEDDDAVRRLVARTLQSHGYHVIEASSPAQALQTVEEQAEFDLLLTDVVMPGMNGRQLAETLLADRPTLRVLFTSGYPADTMIRHGIADGSAAYIGKPYLPIELARKVREVLDTR